MLRRATHDVAVIEPRNRTTTNRWTLVGGGEATAGEDPPGGSRGVIPKHATWIKKHRVVGRPGQQSGSPARTARSAATTRRMPSIQTGLEPDRRPGHRVRRVIVELPLRPRPQDVGPGPPHPKRCQRFSDAVGPIWARRGTAEDRLSAADHWRRQGVLDNIGVHLVLLTLAHLRHRADRRQPRQGGCRLRHHGAHQLRDHRHRRGHPEGHAVGDGRRRNRCDTRLRTCSNEFAQTVGAVDQGQHVHRRRERVRRRRPDTCVRTALGDAGSTPNSKTGAAIRKQAPVVVANVDAALVDGTLPAL